jgi:hypothetical protein
MNKVATVSNSKESSGYHCEGVKYIMKQCVFLHELYMKYGSTRKCQKYVTANFLE